MLEGAEAGREMMVRGTGIRDRREPAGRVEKAIRKGELGGHVLALADGVIHLADHAVGGVGFGRVDEIVIAKERAYGGVGLRIERQSLHRQRIQAVRGDHVAGAG